MTPHTKKLIALVCILVWLVIYAGFIMGLAVRVLPGAPWYASLFFYALAGTLWIVPIGLSLPWMYRDTSRK